ncbi:MAG: C1 family peptidase [Prevotellaceae bacterium]|jgi:aminopeptidase C|nr:C1 family peptidase [Prevotellaceae bacterium]
MKKISILVLLVSFAAVAFAQDGKKEEGYIFTTVKELKVTPVKNQNRSGTCWSFSGLGFIESELLRLGKGEYDLSEMFIVHHSYSDKAEKYVRLHGNGNFAAGGSFYDVLYVLEHYGIVPDAAMNGLQYGEELHVHSELDALAKAYAEAVVKNANRKLSTAWLNGFNGILDAYLGKLPATFSYNGKEYTPQGFFQSLGIRVDDYVSLTSFTHQPFYTAFALEIPDNWRWSKSYNLPLDEFMSIFDYSINNGYTVAWGADVSEKGFSRDGIATVPDVNLAEMSGSDQARWQGLPQKDKDAELYKDKPGYEKNITPELRQQGYDNYETTDDHGMLVYGIANDQNGTKYYMVKNSWGETGKYKGFLYASEAFVKYKTINIVVHKDAIPPAIKQKLGIK